MTVRGAILVILTGVILAACGESGGDPAVTNAARVTTAATAVPPVPAYRRAHAAADAAFRRVREQGEPQGDLRARRAAARCLDTWRSVPEGLRDGALLTFWETVVTREAWRRDEPVIATWLQRLRSIPNLSSEPVLAARVRALKTTHALLGRAYAEPIHACRELAAWQRRGWGNPPRRIARVLSAVDAASSTGGAPVRHAGLYGHPDHHGYCDPVFQILAPEDVFCG